MSKKIIQKNILILGAGLEQTIAIRLAKRMGLRVIAVDENPHTVGLSVADVGVVANISDVKKLITIGKKYKVSGVMTHAVEVPTVVAKVAKALGLPHLAPCVADRATNKFKRIQSIEKAGVSVPKFSLAATARQAAIAAARIGFPVVIKPIDNAGARGVQKITNAMQIKKGFVEAVHYSKSRKPRVLVEQFLQGTEISTESFVYEGKVYTTGFGDRNYSRAKEFAPYFVEDGHNVPSVLPARIQKKVCRVVERAIRGLGIDFGVAKGDILIRKGVVYVIEMAARTSGGWFAAGTVPLATGVHLLKPLIKMSVGEKVLPQDFAPRCKRAACQRYIIPNKDSVFIGVTGVHEARNMSGVKVLQMFKVPKKGDRIRKSRNNTERFGHVIAVGKTVAEATRRCEKAVRRIHIITRP